MSARLPDCVCRISFRLPPATYPVPLPVNVTRHLHVRSDSAVLHILRPLNHETPMPTFRIRILVLVAFANGFYKGCERYKVMVTIVVVCICQCKTYLFHRRCDFIS